MPEAWTKDYWGNTENASTMCEHMSENQQCAKGKAREYLAGAKLWPWQLCPLSAGCAGATLFARHGYCCPFGWVFKSVIPLHSGPDSATQIKICPHGTNGKHLKCWAFCFATLTPPPQHMWMSSVTGGVEKVEGKGGANKLSAFERAESRAQCHSRSRKCENRAWLSLICSAAHFCQERAYLATKQRQGSEKNLTQLALLTFARDQQV